MFEKGHFFGTVKASAEWVPMKGEGPLEQVFRLHRGERTKYGQ